MIDNKAVKKKERKKYRIDFGCPCTVIKSIYHVCSMKSIKTTTFHRLCSFFLYPFPFLPLNLFSSGVRLFGFTRVKAFGIICGYLLVPCIGFLLCERALTSIVFDNCICVPSMFPAIPANACSQSHDPGHSSASKDINTHVDFTRKPICYSRLLGAEPASEQISNFCRPTHAYALYTMFITISRMNMGCFKSMIDQIFQFIPHWFMKIVYEIRQGCF